MGAYVVDEGLFVELAALLIAQEHRCLTKLRMLAVLFTSFAFQLPTPSRRGADVQAAQQMQSASDACHLIGSGEQSVDSSRTMYAIGAAHTRHARRSRQELEKTSDRATSAMTQD